VKINKYLSIFLLLIVFLLGCQQVQEVSEQESDIEIITEDIEDTVETIDDELEKEFDDGLDEALQELEEIENI